MSDQFVLARKSRGAGDLLRRKVTCACGLCFTCKRRVYQRKSRLKKMGDSAKSDSSTYARPSAEWLRQKYWTERLNCTTIAKSLGCDPKTLWQWMKDYGIETRKRGYGDLTVHFKKGQTSRNKGFRLSDDARRRIGIAARARGAAPCYINGVHWMKATGRKPWNWQGGITPERQAFYRSPEWKSAFREVWRRDKGICQCCGLDSKTVDKRTVRFPLHHIDGFKIIERRADPANLILLCWPCHLWIHGKDNVYGYLLGAGHELEAA